MEATLRETADTASSTGPWSSSLDKLQEWDPAWADAFLRMSTNPWTSGVLPRKTVELIGVAVNAACTNLNAEGTRRHIRVLTSYEWRQNTKGMQQRLLQTILLRPTFGRLAWTRISLSDGFTMTGTLRDMKARKSHIRHIVQVMPPPFVGYTVMSLQRLEKPYRKAW